MKFNEKDVTYTLEADYEDIPVKGNAMVSGNDADDKKVEDAIIKRLENGDVWAWAYVKVTATWNGLIGVDGLGCCSYADASEFKKPGGHYNDMKARALEDLKLNIKTLQSKVCNVEVA